MRLLSRKPSRRAVVLIAVVASVGVLIGIESFAGARGTVDYGIKFQRDDWSVGRRKFTIQSCFGGGGMTVQVYQVGPVAVYRLDFRGE